MSDRTKKWIADTMKKIMLKESVDKIRVTEICRKVLRISFSKSKDYFFRHSCNCAVKE